MAPKSHAWNRVRVALALLAPVLVLFHRALFLHGFVIPFDLQEYHFPLAWQVADGLRNLRLPLWDPFTYCGFPLHANVQAQMFYPPAWPFFSAGAVMGPDRMRFLLEWQVVAHVWLAGVFAYQLWRRMGLGRAAAVFGALGFELSGYFVAQSQHLGAICGAAWLPLAWRAALDLETKQNARRAGMLAMALAMAILAGFTAITIVVFVSTFMLAAIIWLKSLSNWRAPLAAACGAIWAIALSGVQLLPTLELSALSTAYKRASFSEDGGGAPWQAFISLIDPNRFGVLFSTDPKLGVNPAFLYIYAGLLVVVLAGSGLAQRHRCRIPLLALAALNGIWMLGGQTAIGRGLWLALPMQIRSATYQEFATPAFLLAFCGLAALGFERWISPRGRVVTGLALAAAMLDAPSQAWKSWMVAMPADRFPVVTRDIFEESKESPLAARRAVADSVPPARLETFRDSLHWMSHAPVLGLATPNGNDPLAMERMLEVRRLYAPTQEWERTGEARRIPSAVLDLLNVHLLVTWDDAGEAPPADHFRLIEAVHGHRFWANPRALPRFFLAQSVVESENLRETLRYLNDPAFDPRTSVVIEGAHIITSASSAGKVRVLRYEPERVELEFETENDAVLVTSESAHPGWEARLDRQPAPLLLANGAFRAMAAPAGRHRVEMVYAPVSLKAGMVLSIISLISLLAVLRHQG